MHLLLRRKLASSIAVLIVLAASYPASLYATTVTGIVPAAVPAPAEEAKPEPDKSVLTIHEPKAIDIWLAKLVYQESRGQTHIKVLDVNGLYSYGCLQFQEGTFRAYALKYGFITPSTPTETRIYDCELQKKIAKLMLAEDPSNWRAWYTSVKLKSVGLPPKQL